MPRARRKPSAPLGGMRLNSDRLGTMARADAEIERLQKRRADLAAAGAFDEVARVDRRISEQRRKIGRMDGARDTGRQYARELSRVRRRGQTRDQLAHLACHVDELRPELLQAADVFRMACGVDAGWPGCSLSFVVPDAAASEGSQPMRGAEQVVSGNSLARFNKARAASGVTHSDGSSDKARVMAPPSTFKPKARNKRQRRASDGGMAAMVDRLAGDRAEAARIRAAFYDALRRDGFGGEIEAAAERVILQNMALTVAAKRIRARSSDTRRKILSAMISGLSGVSGLIGLDFGT